MGRFEIRTARLCLTPFVADHLDDLHELWTNPEVRRYLWDDMEITRERAKDEITNSVQSFENHGFGHWAVTLQDNASFLGFSGLRFFGNSSDVEILYAIAPAQWGQGLATEAARAVLALVSSNASSNAFTPAPIRRTRRRFASWRSWE